MTKAHVTHPELKATFSLDILGVKKNPNGAMYSSLGVITKGGLRCAENCDCAAEKCDSSLRSLAVGKTCFVTWDD
jgi:ribosomal protein S8E